MADWSALPTYRIAANQGRQLVPEYWEAEIIPEAMENLRFMDLARPFPRPGVGKGEIYHIPLGGTMNDAGTLAQGTKIPVDSTAGIRGVNGTMKEAGRGVAIERRLLDLAPSDPQNAHYRFEMSRNINRYIDGILRDAAYGATTDRVNGGTFGRSGGSFFVFGTYANGKMNADVVAIVAERLSNNNVPEFPEGGWKMIMHTFQFSDLMRDATAVSGFIPLVQYTEKGVEKLFKNEVGMLHNIRIVQSTNIRGTLEQASTGTVQTARAVAAGFGGLGFVTGKMPEIYYDPDYEKDFGRVQALAWDANLDAIKLKDAYIIPVQTTVKENITGNGIA